MKVRSDPAKTKRLSIKNTMSPVIIPAINSMICCRLAVSPADLVTNTPGPGVSARTNIAAVRASKDDKVIEWLLEVCFN